MCATTTTTSHHTTSSTTSQLDERINATRQALTQARRERLRNRSDCKMELIAFHLSLKSKQEYFATQLERVRHDRFVGSSRIYQDALAHVYGGLEHLPAEFNIPIVRQQATLLSTWHQGLVADRALEFLKKKEKELHYYMLCEQSTLTTEAIDLIQKEFFEKEVQLNQRYEIQVFKPQRHTLKVQQLVLDELESLLVLQEEIRSHSTGIMTTSPHSSFRTVDWAGTNLKLSSSPYSNKTMHHSLVQLDNTNRCNNRTGHERNPSGDMQSLVKLLLEIDGTFPSAHDEEEELLLGQSMMSFEEFWPSYDGEIVSS